MNQNQSFNLNADFLYGFSGIFLKVVFLVFLVYIIIMAINFLRDKFISTPTDPKKEDIIELLTVLNKLFFVSGFGFILGDIVQNMLNQANRTQPMMSFRGNWDYITFGIIIILIGIAFRVAKKVVLKERS
jgi:hypothetical protein